MANQYRSVLASGGASTGGDALPAEVLAGKTFTNDNGAQTGTMVNNGAVSQTISGGQSYTIPEGYHNGSGVVTATNPSIDIDTPSTSANGEYTFTSDCEVLIINTQNGGSNFTIDNIAFTPESIENTQFRYTASGARTFKYTGHISSGSVLSFSSAGFAAQLYLATV